MMTVTEQIRSILSSGRFTVTELSNRTGSHPGNVRKVLARLRDAGEARTDGMKGKAPVWTACEPIEWAEEPATLESLPYTPEEMRQDVERAKRRVARRAPTMAPGSPAWERAKRRINRRENVSAARAAESIDRIEAFTASLAETPLRALLVRRKHDGRFQGVRRAFARVRHGARVPRSLGRALAGVAVASGVGARIAAVVVGAMLASVALPILAGTTVAVAGLAGVSPRSLVW